MHDKLKQKAISGVIWSAIHKFATVFLGFISGIVLARLLTPHDYGVIGMLTIFLAISQTFIDGGFGSALIQKKHPSDEDYSTILYWNIGLSIFLYLILYSCSPYIAEFYDLPLLSDVLRLQGIVLIINAARIVQHNQLRKMLQFKKVALINLSANLITLIVTIYLAWKGWGVWALVAQQLLLGLLCTILYWVVSKWRPKLCFSKSSFKQLFNFGVFVLFSNLFNTFCNNIQGLLIGKIYNSSTLGYYTKAQRTEGYASTFISSILDQVSYPVLSEAQNDKQRMISIIKKFITTSAYLSFPLLALMILLARPIFIFLYSEKWIDSVPYFQILCLAGGSVCLQSINYYAVAAIGESKDLFKWTVIKRTIGLLFIIAGLYFYGLWGLLWGIVCSSWVIYFINALLVSQHIGYRILPQIKDLLSPAILSCISFAISYFIGSYLNDNMFVKAIVQLAVFLFCFFVCSVFFKAEAYINTTEIFKYLLSNLLKRNDLYRKN